MTITVLPRIIQLMPARALQLLAAHDSVTPFAPLLPCLGAASDGSVHVS
jgi:hypothetical protein